MKGATPSASASMPRPSPSKSTRTAKSTTGKAPSALEEALDIVSTWRTRGVEVGAVDAAARRVGVARLLTYRDATGCSLLWWAANHGYCPVVEWAVSSALRHRVAGFDPNSPDSAGFTPLMMATQNSKFDVVVFLLLHTPGVDIHRRNKAGRTVLHMATLTADPRIGQILQLVAKTEAKLRLLREGHPIKTISPRDVDVLSSPPAAAEDKMEVLQRLALPSAEPAKRRPGGDVAPGAAVLASERGGKSFSTTWSWCCV